MKNNYKINIQKLSIGEWVAEMDRFSARGRDPVDAVRRLMDYLESISWTP